MPRYIDAEVLKHVLNNSKYYGTKAGNAFADMIVECDAADVQEVKHGHWYMEQRRGREIVAMMPKTIETVYVCSECGRVEKQKEPYCNCGAKMDKEKQK